MAATELSRLASTVSWAGYVHQVMAKGTTYPARLLSAIGSGVQYQFTRFNTYQADYDISTDILGRLAAIGPNGATSDWVKGALTATGTNNYLLLSQPASSQVIGFQLQ